MTNEQALLKMRASALEETAETGSPESLYSARVVYLLADIALSLGFIADHLSEAGR